jgi:hypothetical protein
MLPVTKAVTASPDLSAAEKAAARAIREDLDVLRRTATKKKGFTEAENKQCKDARGRCEKHFEKFRTARGLSDEDMKGMLLAVLAESGIAVERE